MRQQLTLDRRPGLARQRQCRGVLVIGDQRLPRIDPRRGEARFVEGGSDDAAADDFADGGDRIQ